MLLRNKKNGLIYAYHKVLMDSGEYEVFEEQKPVPVSEQPAPSRARRKRVAINITGDLNGTDPK